MSFNLNGILWGNFETSGNKHHRRQALASNIQSAVGSEPLNGCVPVRPRLSPDGRRLRDAERDDIAVSLGRIIYWIEISLATALWPSGNWIRMMLFKFPLCFWSATRSLGTLIDAATKPPYVRMEGKEEQNQPRPLHQINIGQLFINCS